MKQRTQTKTRPEYTIVEKDGAFKVFDKNGHFRRPFGTRQDAEDFITEQRTGKKVQRATTDMTQAAVGA